MGSDSDSRPPLGRILIAALLCLVLTAAASAANPVPFITNPLSPQAVAPGSAGFTLTVRGANFVSGAIVNWNGSARATTFISSAELQAQILASDVPVATAGLVTVTNPGGVASSGNYGTVEVSRPTSAMVIRTQGFYGDPGHQIFSAVTADFNSDGKPDLSVASGDGFVSAFLGQGDGTFLISSKYRAAQAAALTSGDFNGDGKADVSAVASHFAILLGNGDGTFLKTGGFGNVSTGIPRFSVAGDFNRDGNIDLAVTDSARESMAVLLGDGDGTFSTQLGFRAPTQPIEVVTADFNGDGILDFVVWSNLGSRRFGFSILLGNGDGTFQSPRQITKIPGLAGAFTSNLLVNDFNGDGKFDLAIGTTGQVGILLGNGDGTFAAPMLVSSGYAAKEEFSFAAGDFNSDGSTDLITCGLSSQKFSVLFGNGDGTFQAASTVDLHGAFDAETGIITGDFDSNGLLDFGLQSGSGGIEVFIQ